MVVMITDNSLVGHRYSGPYDTAMLFFLSSYNFLHWDISLRVEGCSGTFFDASKGASMLYLLPAISVVDTSLCACGPI